MPAVPRLMGHHVVITGAAGGLGPVAAAVAVAEGAEVTLVDADAGRVASVASGLPEASVRGRRAADLLDPAAAEALAADLAPGGVDAVWHLVGGYRGGAAFEEASLDDWALLHDLAVRTTLHVARAFTVPLLASPHGRFATVSSPVSTRPTSTAAAYAAAKAGSDAVALALADRFAGSSATSNIVVVSSILMPDADPGTAPASAVPAAHVADALVLLSSATARTMNGQRLRLVGAGV